MNPRALRALGLRRHGFKLKHIAKHFGVTKERARQLCTLGLELERRASSTDPWDELSPRLRHALTACGCEPTPQGVVRFLQVCDWKRVPAMGVKSYADLQKWLIKHGQESTPWKP